MNKNKDNRKVAIYSRKSKFTGKGESTANQIEICKKKILFHYEDIDLEGDVLIFEDEGFSGYTTNRPAFQNMLKRIRNNEIKAIVFYKLDRISRNVTDFSNLLNELSYYNVSFISATESIENVTPSGRAMMFMISVFAQLERDTTAERIRDNMMELAKTGRWLGGNTPTGFKSTKIKYITLDGKNRHLYKLSSINEEKIIIKLLFKKMLEVKSLSGVETYTLQNDIKTRNGKKFTRWSLKNIFYNPVYAIADNDSLEYFKKLGVSVYFNSKDIDKKRGLIGYNKTKHLNQKNMVIKKNIENWIVAIGRHEGFVSGKEWVEVQNIMKQNCNMKYRKPTVTNALLSSIIKCSHCGSYLRPKAKKEQYKDSLGRRKFSYMCELKDKSRKVKCQCKNINGLEADDLVIKEIRRLTNSNRALYKELKKISKNEFRKEKNYNEEVKMLKSSFSKNEKEIKSLIEKIKYIDISLIDDISNEIKRLKKNNKEINKELLKLERKNNDELNDKEIEKLLINIFETYKNSFNQLNLNSKRNLLKLIASDIKTDGKNIYVNLIGTKNSDFIPTGDSRK